MPDQKIHPDAAQYGGWEWKEGEGGYTYCSFCGSIGVTDAIELLKTVGTYYSGTDWKYGWPHKFYIDNFKFYSLHLKEASEEQLEEFSELCGELLGVVWLRDKDSKIVYRAISAGWQTWGNVGAGPADDAPVVPPDWKDILNPTIH